MFQSNNKILSIGEVAKSLGITRRIILNYEDKGLLHADKKEGASGNRYYSLDSVTRIRTIRLLQSFGLSLDEIYAYYNGTTNLIPVASYSPTLFLGTLDHVLSMNLAGALS